MSAVSTIAQINSQIVNNAPAVVLAVQQYGAAVNATGAQKQSVAVRVLTGIEAGTEAASGVLENSPNPLIAGTATLVNLIVQIAKLFQHPAFVAPVAQPPQS